MSSCQNCGYLSSDKQGCLLLNIRIVDHKKCDFFTYRPKQCDVCGRLLPPQTRAWLEKLPDGNYALVCDECFAQIGQCAICAKAHEECAFLEAARYLGVPTMSQKVVRQGNMQMIKQEKNPQVVEQACPNCGCYKNNICLREQNVGCESFQINLVPM